MKEIDFKTTIEKIKNAIALSSIVGKDVYLQQKGREFVGSCPFHAEKTGSFYVNNQKGTFYCFGCQASGDVIEYLIMKDGITFMQAISKLSAITGIKLPEKKSAQHYDTIELQILQKASDFFCKKLKSNQEAMLYCQNRGLSKEVLDSFKIGYAPINTKELYEFLESAGFSQQEITKTSIHKFRDRILFPILDSKGWPIAFGGRAMDNNTIPKYLNSPESELFQKRETIYGYNIASKNSSQKNQIIIVEGYVDVLMMHQFNFTTTVATMGTSFSAEHFKKIWRYSTDPILCFDGDTAGRKAMDRAALLALLHITPEHKVQFCLLPEKEDPDSVLRNFGQQFMQKLLSASIPLVDFLWSFFIESLANSTELNYSAKKTPEQIAKWKKDIFQTLTTIANKNIQQLYISEFKNRIFEHFRWRKKDAPALEQKNLFLTINRSNKILLREAILLYTIIKYPKILNNVVAKLSLVDFSHEQLDSIKCSIIEHLDNQEHIQFSEESFVNLKPIAEQYCNFDHMEKQEIIAIWDNIFSIAFWKNAVKEDIQIAKKECCSKLDEKTWRRLKALKINTLSNNKIDK